MKLHQLVFLFGLLVVILLSSGCGKQGNSEATTPATTTLANSTKKYTATRTVISPILTKPSTPIPIATQPYIPTPGFTATSSSIPTLAVEDARAMLNDLLVNNGYCHLPCLWGISPGATTSQEANMILSPMGGLTNFNVLQPDIGNISINDPMENDLLLSIFVAYLADQGTVFSTSFQAQALKH